MPFLIASGATRRSRVDEVADVRVTRVHRQLVAVLDDRRASSMSRSRHRIDAV